MAFAWVQQCRTSSGSRHYLRHRTSARLASCPPPSVVLCAPSLGASSGAAAGRALSRSLALRSLAAASAVASGGRLHTLAGASASYHCSGGFGGSQLQPRRRRRQQYQQHQAGATTTTMHLPLPLLLSVTAALTLRPRSTLGEQARLEPLPPRNEPQDRDAKASGRPSSYYYQRGSSQKLHAAGGGSGGRSPKASGPKPPPAPRQDCPFYGCPLTPLDVHYNTEPIKAALQDLRQSKRADAAATSSTAAASQALLRTSGHEAAVTLTLIGYKGGPLHEQINQDRAIVVAPFVIPRDLDAKKRNKGSRSAAPEEEEAAPQAILLGVFDGHAPRGELVSEFTARELPVLLSQKLSQAYRDRQKAEALALPIATVKQILNDTFVELDSRAPAQGSGGCTASVILALDSKIYVANAGDSRSFIVTYRPSTKTTRVVYLSREDKPDLPDERARVEAAGGQVYIPARGTSRVVYHDPRTGAPSGLAMSRSIGDWAAGKLGVIPDPIVDVIDVPTLLQDEHQRNQSLSDESDSMTSTFLFLDEQGDVVATGETFFESAVSSDTNDQDAVDDIYIFGVSASDGMLDYLDHQDIAKVLAKALFEDDGAHPLTAAEHLVFAAANGWQQDKQGRYRDDIAIAVATLRRPPVKEESDVSSVSSEL